jgi:hypothetical protein
MDEPAIDEDLAVIITASAWSEKDLGMKRRLDYPRSRSRNEDARSRRNDGRWRLVHENRSFQNIQSAITVREHHGQSLLRLASTSSFRRRRADRRS